MDGISSKNATLFKVLLLSVNGNAIIFVAFKTLRMELFGHFLIVVVVVVVNPISVTL